MTLTPTWDQLARDCELLPDDLRLWSRPRKVSGKFPALCNFAAKGDDVYQGGFRFRGSFGGDSNRGNALGCPFGSIVFHRYDPTTGTGCNRTFPCCGSKRALPVKAPE